MAELDKLPEAIIGALLYGSGVYRKNIETCRRALEPLREKIKEQDAEIVRLRKVINSIADNLCKGTSITAPECIKEARMEALGELAAQSQELDMGY